MNKDNAKDYLPLVQALAEGKVIQFNDGSRWRDLGSGHISWDYAAKFYRIKPEPREIWVRRHEDGTNSAYVYSSKQEAEDCSKEWTAVHYREVIE
ncbi:hypothetical protein ACN9MD_09575 [Stenotrophomonas maltophilia]|uniref:hypothetical protein n=1 Tax=Stenotrophomonas maltophilia TaxID=40324 RepID=UPI003CF91606